MTRLRKLTLLAAMLIAVALLFLGANRVNAQPTWASYSDSGHNTPSDTFAELNCTVYMYGEGFTKNANYKIIYWDENGDKRVAEVQKALTPAGKLSSQHTFGSPDVAGNWHCTVYSPSTYDPASYDAGDANIVADDTSYTGGYAFYAAESAIPEFSTVFTGIMVLGLCFGIYYWMRKRHRRIAAPVAIC